MSNTALPWTDLGEPPCCCETDCPDPPPRDPVYGDQPDPCNEYNFISNIADWNSAQVAGNQGLSLAWQTNAYPMEWALSQENQYLVAANIILFLETGEPIGLQFYPWLQGTSQTANNQGWNGNERFAVRIGTYGPFDDCTTGLLCTGGGQVVTSPVDTFQGYTVTDTVPNALQFYMHFGFSQRLAWYGVESRYWHYSDRPQSASCPYRSYWPLWSRINFPQFKAIIVPELGRKNWSDIISVQNVDATTRSAATVRSSPVPVRLGGLTTYYDNGAATVYGHQCGGWFWQTTGGWVKRVGIYITQVPDGCTNVWMQLGRLYFNTTTGNSGTGNFSNGAFTPRIADTGFTQQLVGDPKPVWPV